MGESLKSNQDMVRLDDPDLISLSRIGDIPAFETLVRRYEKRVMVVAGRIVGNPQDARDVTQKVFIRVYRYLDQFRNDRNFFTWLYRIIVNASFDFLKREKRFRAVPLDDVAADHIPAANSDTADEKMFQQQVLLWLDTLSPTNLRKAP